MAEHGAGADSELERLARLERQNHRLRRLLVASAAVAVLALVAPAALHAQAKSRARAVIDGDKLVLRNADGQTVGFFGVDRNGFANLGFLDRKGNVRSSMGMDEHGNPALVLLDPQGNVRVTMAQSGETAAFLMFDRNKVVRLTSTVEADGTANFGLRDDKGEETWKPQ